MIPAHYYVEDFEDGTLTSSTGRIDRHPLIADTLTAGSHPGSSVPGRRREDDTNLVADTVRSHPRPGSNSSGQIFAFSHTQGIDAQASETDWPTLRREGGGHGVYAQAAVRRLTPRECERLQGFPDDWTTPGPDSRRYAALGDAVTVNVAEWIGRRLVAHEAAA